MTSTIRSFEGSDKHARQAIHVDFVRGEDGGRADGIISCEFNMREVQAPVSLLFITDQCKHLTNGAVDTRRASVGSCDTACVEFQDLELRINSCGKMCTKVQAMVRLKGERAAPYRYVTFNENVVPSAVHSVEVTAYTFSRRLKRSVIRYV